MSGEVSEEWGLVGQAHASDLFTFSEYLKDYLDKVVDVALGVDASWNCESDEVHLGGFCKHQGANLDGADATLEIEFGG